MSLFCATACKNSISMKDWTIALQAQGLKDRDAKIKQLEADKAQSDLLINNHYAFMELPGYRMADMVRDGRAKPVAMFEFQRQFQKQFNMPLADQIADGKVQWIQQGHFKYRLPAAFWKAFAERSRIDRFPFSDSEYHCNDFALSLWSEVNLGPYFLGLIGIITTLKHCVNLIWPSDGDIAALEPQNDTISVYTPTTTIVKLIT